MEWFVADCSAFGGSVGVRLGVSSPGAPEREGSARAGSRFGESVAGFSCAPAPTPRNTAATHTAAVRFTCNLLRTVAASYRGAAVQSLRECAVGRDRGGGYSMRRRSSTSGTRRTGPQFGTTRKRGEARARRGCGLPARRQGVPEAYVVRPAG